MLWRCVHLHYDYGYVIFDYCNSDPDYCICAMLSMQSECKRFTSSVEELETELNKVTVRSEELRQQLDDKLEMCRLMEVYTFIIHSMYACMQYEYIYPVCK